MQGEDGLPNLLDGFIEFIDRPADALPRDIRNVITAQGSLQHHPGGKQALNHQVV